MKIRMLTLNVLFIGLCLVLTPSCSDDDSNPTPSSNNNNNTSNNNNENNNNNNNDPVKTGTEMLAKKWIVDMAFVNGSTPDLSSKGLTLDVRTDGTYTLSTGWIGTWEFEDNETKINWDKNTPQFNQVFTLQEFTDTKIDATFISAFTGQDARWIMIPN